MRLSVTQLIAMETINQLCARHSYHEFIEAIGGKAIHRTEVIGNGYGYDGKVGRFHEILSTFNISRADAYKHFKNIILTSDYADIQSKLEIFLGNKQNAISKDIIKKIIIEMSGTRNVGSFKDFLREIRDD